ncbi:hypothetical protein BJX63DRAFT_437005 [Aspergillus granulosus]|uniref:Uncharacterized protein n=1 Tax=Aspergillus granulosus TaxID=176169 RepID=A0ABR4GWF3_9EURO
MPKGQEKKCSGYQDLNALRFFDQTEAVAAKAQARAAAAAQQQAAEQAALAAAKRAAALPIIALPTSIHEQALSHTLKCYVGTDQSRGTLSYLPALLRTDPSDALQAAVRAIGLASISRIHHIPTLQRSASEEYSLALRVTNSNLQHASSAKSDSTLATVLLLGLYEIIACHGSDMLGGWLNHVQGAIKLLELRGEEQLKSPAGMELFTIAMSNLFFRTKYHTSAGIASLSRLAIALRDSNSHAVETFYAILIPFNNLSIAVKDAHTRDGFRGNIAPLITKALRLDADLASWAVSLEPAWRYTIVQHPPSHSHNRLPLTLHDTEYHTYPNISAAALWNHYRYARIVLHEMLLSLVSSVTNDIPEEEMPPETQQILLQSSSLTQQLVKDVCASVPFFFTSDEARFTAVARLPWPLFVAADCTYASPYTRDWIVQVLDLLARSTGVQQARIMADLLGPDGIGSL